MTIIEKSLIGKKSQETCEDGIVITNDFVAVIDGSTSKTSRQVCKGISNGRYAMLLISDYLMHAEPDLSLKEICMGMTIKLSDASPLATPPSTLLPHERMAASVALYSRHYQQIWLIGDCQAMVVVHHEKGSSQYLTTNDKPIEAINAGKRSRYILQALSTGASIKDFQINDTGREVILNDIITSMKEQNKDYAVVDGTPIAIDKVVVISLPPAGTAYDIILATDGYPFLHATLQESEEHLQRQLREDPLCINTFKATKGLMKGCNSFDDRAYIRFHNSSYNKPL